MSEYPNQSLEAIRAAARAADEADGKPPKSLETFEYPTFTDKDSPEEVSLDAIREQVLRERKTRE